MTPLEGLAIVLLSFAIPKVKYLFMKEDSRWDGRQLNWFQRCVFLGIRDFAVFWNRLEVHGLEVVEEHKDSCLLVGYHSRCTLDILYVLCCVQPNVIATYLMFKVPIMRSLLQLVNIMPSKSNNDSNAELGFIKALTVGKRPLLLLPGGAFECLKPYAQVGKIQWKEVPGFARVIHEEDEMLGKRVKVIPFYTKNCDRCMFTCESWYETFGVLSCKAYEMFKRGNFLILPLMLTFMLQSLGCLLIPRPVKLDTYFGEPLSLRDQESASSFARRVAAATQGLVDRIEAMPAVDELTSCEVDTNSTKKKVMLGKKGGNKGGTSQATKTIKKQFGVWSWWESIEFVLVGIYGSLQNIILLSLLFSLLWFPLILMLFGFLQLANMAARSSTIDEL